MHHGPAGGGTSSRLRSWRSGIADYGTHPPRQVVAAPEGVLEDVGVGGRLPPL